MVRNSVVQQFIFSHMLHPKYAATKLFIFMLSFWLLLFVIVTKIVIVFYYTYERMYVCAPRSNECMHVHHSFYYDR